MMNNLRSTYPCNKRTEAGIVTKDFELVFTSHKLSPGDRLQKLIALFTCHILIRRFQADSTIRGPNTTTTWHYSIFRTRFDTQVKE
jgi:hypothetical protein